MICSAFRDWIGFDRKHGDPVFCTLPSLSMHQAEHNQIMTHSLEAFARKAWR
jgi:hypothetical protein